MAQLVAKQYAKALLEIAIEKNLLDEYHDQAGLILDSINTDIEFGKTILHPQITTVEKMQLFKTVFGDSVSSDFLGLLEVLLRKNREEEVTYVLDYFMKSVQEYKGFVMATVQSAVPLSTTQLERTRASLEKILGKKVDITTEIVPQLIGGLCIKADGRVLDASVRKQFDEMKKLLKECTTK